MTNKVTDQIRDFIFVFTSLENGPQSLFFIVFNIVSAIFAATY